MGYAKASLDLSALATDSVSIPHSFDGARRAFQGGRKPPLGSDPMESESGALNETLDVLALSVDWDRLAVDTLNLLGTGIALLDRLGRAVFANSAGARMLESCAIIKPHAHVPLGLANPRSNAELRRAIIDAVDGSSTGLCVRDYGGSVILSAVVVPLPLPMPWVGGRRPPAVLLAMYELAHPRGIPNRWLSQMFGLTGAEAAVTNWLISGRTIDAYARCRGISLETARSQLKAVLSKTGMSRQAQLVAALSRLAVEASVV